MLNVLGESGRREGHVAREDTKGTGIGGYTGWLKFLKGKLKPAFLGVLQAGGRLQQPIGHGAARLLGSLGGG